jgi:hypothetical protein
VSTMDTIYSNKKYLQSLNAADYYRAGTTLRPSVSIYQQQFVPLITRKRVSLLFYWRKHVECVSFCSSNTAVLVLISVLINFCCDANATAVLFASSTAFKYLCICCDVLRCFTTLQRFKPRLDLLHFDSNALCLLSRSCKKTSAMGF